MEGTIFITAAEMAEILGISKPYAYKIIKQMNEEKVGKAMVQIKRDWFDTEFGNYERGKTHGRWKEKIQI